jgi:hypothetical protein
VECQNISLETVIWGVFTQMRFFVLAEGLDMFILRAAATEGKRLSSENYSFGKRI